MHFITLWILFLGLAHFSNSESLSTCEPNTDNTTDVMKNTELYQGELDTNSTTIPLPEKISKSQTSSNIFVRYILPVFLTVVFLVIIYFLLKKYGSLGYSIFQKMCAYLRGYCVDKIGYIRM